MAVAAIGGLVFSGLGATAAEARNPNNSEKMTQAVTVEAVHDHLEAFQAIAESHDGNRAAGTAGYVASAEYVEMRLRAAGYEPERQYFDFIYEEVLAESLTVTGLGALDPIVMAYSPDTPVGGFTGEFVVPSGDQRGCTSDAWTGVDATGRIALISRGACAFADKSVYAGLAGAEAAIVYNNVPGDLNGTLGAPDERFVPTAGITQEAGQQILAALQSGALTATVELRQLSETRRTFNVIAETDTGRDDNVVMMGAHLDGVLEGAGINDNGTGSAAILETAIQLAKVNKLNNTVRFAWWGAEENGLVGSTHYVNDLVENAPEQLEDIATYLNFDMIGSPNYIIGVYDADESTYDSGDVPIPAGSAASEDVFTDYFDATGQPWVDTAFSGRSDYQAFINNGVPATGLFTGADGTKTEAEVELFGGTAGITYDPNYHSVDDDIDNVDLVALDIMSDAIAHAAITLAQDTSPINGERSAGKSGNPHPQGPVAVEEEPAA